MTEHHVLFGLISGSFNLIENNAFSKEEKSFYTSLPSIVLTYV